MKAYDLTRWGAILLFVQGVCMGFLLSPSLTAVSVFLPLALAVGGMVTIGLLTPLLRALGWRQLAIRASDINPNPPPRPNEVERALRTLLAEGRSFQDAVRILHQTFGWDVIELSPAVAAVVNVPQKEAIRLVASLTVLAESRSESELA